jgi:hypothetical protein
MDCTLLNGTASAPISNVMPLLLLVSPVAVPTTLNGTAVAELPLLPVSSAIP